MKKMICFCLCVLLLIGCNGGNKKVSQIDFKDYLIDDSDSFEILDVDDKYLYMNTYESRYGLLYDSKSVVVMDHEGNHVNSYKMDGEFRVLDFIIWNDIPYYMALTKDNNEYVCELVKINNDISVSVNKWVLNDPYNYPSFYLSSERVFYRVDNYLYSLDTLEPLMNDNVKWLFALEEPHRKTVGYKVLNDEGKYDIYASSNEDKPIFSHEYIGEFYLDEKEIIFNSRNSFNLYTYNIESQKTKCIYDKEIDNFKVGHDYIGISTQKEVIIYNKDNYKVNCTINKDKYNINPVEYIYVIENNFYVVSEDKKIVRIGVES